MKYLFSIVALIAAFASPALAQTKANLDSATFTLNTSSPNAQAIKRLGDKVMRESLRSVELTYSFSAQGGATTASINLNSATSGLSSSLPQTAIIRNCVIDVVTAPTSLGSATIAFSSGQTTADLLAATAIASLGIGLHACIPVGTAATGVKLTADSKPTLSVATAALTAGVIHVIVDYSMSE